MLSQKAKFHSLLLLSDTPLCVCPCGYIYIYIIYTKHFLYLFIFGGYLGCLYILGIVNNSTINIGVLVSFLHSALFYSGKCPAVEFLELLIFLFLNFWGTSLVFYLVAGLIDTFTNSTWGFVLNLYLTLELKIVHRFDYIFSLLLTSCCFCKKKKKSF